MISTVIFSHSTLKTIRIWLRCFISLKIKYCLEIKKMIIIKIIIVIIAVPLWNGLVFIFKARYYYKEDLVFQMSLIISIKLIIYFMYFMYCKSRINEYILILLVIWRQSTLYLIRAWQWTDMKILTDRWTNKLSIMSKQI